MGLPLASTAASVMAKALGGSQFTNLQSLSALGSDPLTHYLSKISRHQLNEIMSEMKALATQNKPLAQQLLQGSPQLPKALFQAQIMMGLVSPQMMQMASDRQLSSSAPQTSLKDNTRDQKPILSSYLGQIPPQKEAIALYPRPPEVPNVLPPLHHAPLQPQHPLAPQYQVHPQGMMLGKPGVPSASPLPHHPLGSLSIQPKTPPLLTSKSSIPQIQPPLLQHSRPIGGANTALHSHLPLPSTSVQLSVQPHSVTPQVGSSSHSVLFGLETLPKDAESSASANQNLSWPSRLSSNPSSGIGLMEQTGMTGDMSELMIHPSKRPRLENGSSALVGSSSVSGQSIATGSLSASQTASADRMQQSEKQMPQLPPDVESALLQQVMSLTPEQLSSLPLEQQQQVLQLQQMLR